MSKSAKWSDLLCQLPAVLIGCLFLYWGARIDARWFARHLLLLSFQDRPPARALLPSIRYALLGSGLAFLLIVRPMLARWARKKTLRAALGDLLRMSVALVLSLCVCELVLRHRAHGTRSREIAAPAPDLRMRLCEPHARYGWLPLPSRTVPVPVGDHAVEFAIDAEHNRAPAVDRAIDHAQPSILFAGESVMIGTGVRYEDSFPARVGTALGVQAINLAVPGYGSDQAYLRLIDALPHYEHPIAVVTMFLPGMLGRNFQYGRPHLELDAGQLIAVPPRPPFVELKLVDLVTDKIPYWSEGTVVRSLQLTGALLADTASRARARGAVPLFVVSLWADPPPLAERADAAMLHELFDARGLEYVVVESDSSYQIPGDGHPDARAHVQIADATISALRRLHVATR